LIDGLAAEEGLAWAAGGKELLFSGWTESDPTYQICAIDLAGRLRHPVTVPGGFTLQDAAPGGAWLATSDDTPGRIMGRSPGAAEERDLSWLDSSGGPLISRDGLTLALSDWGRSSGVNYNVILRKMDGSPALHLGEGSATDLSADARWVLVTVPTTPARLMLYPTGPGEPRRIDRGELEAQSDGRFMPDGKSVFVCGNAAGKAPRCYVRPIEGGDPRPVTPEGVDRGLVSPDGASVVVRSTTGETLLCPVNGGAPRSLPFIPATERVLRFSPDGTKIWVLHTDRVESVELASGRRETVLQLAVGGGEGMVVVSDVSLADDPRAYAYSIVENASRLFQIEGAR